MKIVFQRPNIGSKWYYGNFSLGLMIDSHPRFFNFIIALVIFEIVISWDKDTHEARGVNSRIGSRSPQAEEISSSCIEG